MSTVKGITVYCASSQWLAAPYVEAATALGAAVARRQVPLITGAGRMGLMGAVNDGAIAAGGTTIGVIPRFMVERGWHHLGLSRLEITPDMHARKEMMASLAAGVIALPGGFGTLEELLEIITWRQLGLYEGNIVILNVKGYYDNLLAMIGHAVDQRVIPADHPATLFGVATTPDEAVAMALAPAGHQQLSPKFKN
jgi:hypothetical protein